MGVGTPLYQLRSGDYLVLYGIDEALVTVMRVIYRPDLERILRRPADVKPAAEDVRAPHAN